MKAVVFDRYGPPDVLRVEEIERPEPKDDEVLVKVRATTVNRTDCGFRAAEPFFSRFFTGLLRPKYRTPGMELAGEVVAVGGAVRGSPSATRCSACAETARTPSTSAFGRAARLHTSRRP